jgi:hypothetical protein
MRLTRRTLAFGAAALALLPGQRGMGKRVRGDAVWHATRAWLNEQIFGVNRQMLGDGTRATKGNQGSMPWGLLASARQQIALEAGSAAQAVDNA